MAISSGDESLDFEKAAERLAVEQSDFLAVMANRHRLHILFLLSECEHSVGDLMRELRETPVGVSRHLTILRENNIITSRRCGKIVRYSLVCQRAFQMMKTIAEIQSLQDQKEDL